MTKKLSKKEIEQINNKPFITGYSLLLGEYQALSYLEIVFKRNLEAMQNSCFFVQPNIKYRTS